MRVYVAGTFDLLHPGHIELFRRAAQVGEVVVSLNTDEFASRYKRPPVMSLEERRTMVGACRYVSEVIVNEGGEDSKPAILASDAKVIVHGDDWPRDGLLKQMGLTEEWLAERGIELRYLPYTAGVSSSEILGRVRAA